MRFVDLFCGIGGFHAALHRLGHECVFATDIDKHAAATYEMNWGKPGGFDVNCDIRKVLDEIPEMDIICAGFPASRLVSLDLKKDSKIKPEELFSMTFVRWLRNTNRKVLFLENVPHLVKHDNGNTFAVIQERLDELGYDFEWSILSPHKFGIPQCWDKSLHRCNQERFSKQKKLFIPKRTRQNRAGCKDSFG